MNRPLLRRLFPFLRWWPRVERPRLPADLVAGLVGAVMVLPPGGAFALLARPPPVRARDWRDGPTNRARR